MSLIHAEVTSECQHCSHLQAKVAALDQKLAQRDQDLEQNHTLSHQAFVKLLEANLQLWQHQIRLKDAEERVASSESRLKVSQEEAKSRELFLKRSNQDLRASLDRKSTTGRKALEKLVMLRDELRPSDERPPTPQSEQDHAPKDAEDLRVEIDDLCRDLAALAAPQMDTDRTMKDRDWPGSEMAKVLQLQASLAQSLGRLCVEANAAKEHNKRLVTDLEAKDAALNGCIEKLKQEEARNMELGKQIESLEMMMPLGWMTQRRGTLGLVGLRKKTSPVQLDRHLE